MTGRTASYKAGDQVELISGSPDMTVLHCDGVTVWLAWCGDDDTGTLHQAELPIGAVQPIKGTSPRCPGPSGGYGHRAPAPGTARLNAADLDDEIPF